MGKFSLQANSYTGWQLKDFDLYTKVDEGIYLLIYLIIYILISNIISIYLYF